MVQHGSPRCTRGAPRQHRQAVPSQRAQQRWWAPHGEARWRCSTRATVVMWLPEITQRELRNNCGEIMRQLDDGESFVVTRNGVRLGRFRLCVGIDSSAPA